VQFLGNDENIFPNVITPNNDGLNDELRFGAFCGYNHIAIFDRWGVEVFNADVQSGLVWNGTDKKGKALSEGVYYYCLSGGNVESYKGIIHIQR
jgi:gliding motility-associated-like protein